MNEHYEGDGAVIYKHVCEFGCEGIVSKRSGSPYRSGRSGHWLKVKNPTAPAVRREADEDWGGKRNVARPVSREPDYFVAALKASDGPGGAAAGRSAESEPRPRHDGRSRSLD